MQKLNQKLSLFFMVTMLFINPIQAMKRKRSLEDTSGQQIGSLKRQCTQWIGEKYIQFLDKSTPKNRTKQCKKLWKELNKTPREVKKPLLNEIGKKWKIKRVLPEQSKKLNVLHTLYKTAQPEDKELVIQTIIKHKEKISTFVSIPITYFLCEKDYSKSFKQQILQHMTPEEYDKYLCECIDYYSETKLHELIGLNPKRAQKFHKSKAIRSSSCFPPGFAITSNPLGYAIANKKPEAVKIFLQYNIPIIINSLHDNSFLQTTYESADYPYYPYTDKKMRTIILSLANTLDKRCIFHSPNLYITNKSHGNITVSDIKNAKQMYHLQTYTNGLIFRTYVPIFVLSEAMDIFSQENKESEG